MESLLLAQEVRIEKYKQLVVGSVATINVARVAPTDVYPTPQVHVAQKSQLYSTSHSSHFGGGRNGLGQGRGDQDRGRGGRHSVQYQSLPQEWARCFCFLVSV